MWCDTVTDGGGYSYWPCSGCVSVYRTTDVNGCAAQGLSMIIPRTQANWDSIQAFVQGTLGSSMNTYFQVATGKKTNVDKWDDL